MQTPPLIVHVVHRLDYGGLENGVVNLINNMPDDRFRHAIISLTEVSEFSKRLKPGVDVAALHKKPGQDWALYMRLWRQFRQWRPAIVHTRNLATFEAQVPALLAGIAGRVHGEHGRDVHDLDNTSSRYRHMRWVLSHLVQRYTSVSKELYEYICDDVGISRAKAIRICNGVDSTKFSPGEASAKLMAEVPFDTKGKVVIGTVGRMQTVKDQMNLARAFVELTRSHPDLASRTVLVMIGDGPLRNEVAAFLDGAGCANLVWMPGARDDTPDLLRLMDIFVLPSLAEGISNTVLEAMATGLPVVATDVGGNPELVAAGVTGNLVPRADPAALAQALADYIKQPGKLHAHGAAARHRVEQEFSLEVMVRNYQAMYEELLTA